jgi:protein-tyrosine phosphatase
MLRKGLGILFRRLREQGLRVTMLWMMDHALRLLTGMSPPRTSRIAPNLYLGGQHYRHGLARLARLGISASVNLREEADDRVRGVTLEEHLWLPTVDDGAPTVEHLRAASAFIGQALAGGRGVYVHCASGVGRAATAVAAYLVSNGSAPDQAWATIRRVRPFIRPKAAQMAGVEKLYEQSPLASELESPERK